MKYWHLTYSLGLVLAMLIVKAHAEEKGSFCRFAVEEAAGIEDSLKNQYKTASESQKQAILRLIAELKEASSKGDENKCNLLMGKIGGEFHKIAWDGFNPRQKTTNS